MALVGLVWSQPGVAVAAEYPTPVVRPAPARCATEPPLWSDVVTGELDAALRCVGHLGLMDGYRDGRFHPEFEATRADAIWAMANVLRVAGVEVPDDAPDAFDDDGDSGVERFANGLAALGVLRGTGSRTLHADVPLVRAQLAALAVRSAEVGDRLLDDSTDWFRDDDQNLHVADIDRGAAGGILAGTGEHFFHPLARLTRGHVAMVSARLVNWLEDPAAAEDVLPPA